MEKRIAHYNLDSIKQLIKDSKYRITNSARIDYSRLGFSDDEVIDIILKLKASDLYKSMTMTSYCIIQYGKMYIQKLKKSWNCI